MTAARVGNVDAVKTLLDHGATVDTRDPAFQQTALMMAVREDHPDVVKLLVDRGANVNVQTRTGATPPWILPELRAGLRPWHRHRARRLARSRLALPDSGRDDAAALRGARRPRRVREDAPRGRRRARTHRRQRHHAAPDGDHEQPRRHGALPDRAGRQREGRRLVRPHAAVGRDRTAQHGRRQLRRSKTASIARRRSS